LLFSFWPDISFPFFKKGPIQIPCPQNSVFSKLNKIRQNLAFLISYLKLFFIQQLQPFPSSTSSFFHPKPQRDYIFQNFPLFWGIIQIPCPQNSTSSHPKIQN
jgi:uncharacterized membrane protein